MIEIKALTKKFGNFTALDNINFSAESGEIITLLGPNGAGKSTLMKCICGYWKPDGGNVFIDNVNLGENLLSSLKEDVKLYIEYDESFTDSLHVSDVTSSQR